MDFITDQSGRHLIRIGSMLALPDYVKEASLDDESAKTWGDGAFAWPARREFPCHTPGHAYWSHAYIKSAGINDPVLKQCVARAVELFGIEADVAAFDAAFDSHTKQAAAPAPRCAIELNFGDGSQVKTAAESSTTLKGVHGFYPINTADEVELSAEQLAKDASRLPLLLVVDGCENLVKAAKTHAVPENRLPSFVLAYGRDRLPDPEFLTSQAEKRATETNDGLYRELAVTAIENPEGLPAKAYAELWHTADLQNGVKYSSTNLDAFRIFKTGIHQETQEAEFAKWCMVNATAVPAEAIQRIPENRIRALLPKQAAETLLEVIKEARQMPELARGERLSARLGQMSQAIQKTALRLAVEAS
jgi:hypothetical protein